MVTATPSDAQVAGRSADQSCVNRARVSAVVLVGVLVVTFGFADRSYAHSGPVIWQGQPSPVSFVFVRTTPRLRAITLFDGAGYRLDSAEIATWTTRRTPDGIVLGGPPADRTVTLRLLVTGFELGPLQVPYLLTFADGTTEAHDGEVSFHFTVFDSAKRTAGVIPATLAQRSGREGGLPVSPVVIGTVALLGTGALYVLRRASRPA